MKEASACNPFDVSKIESQVKTLIASITDTEKACVNKTTAAVDLIKDYGLTGADPSKIEQEIVSYVIDHILTICGTIGNIS